MSIVLRIVAICAALCLGVVLSLLVVFGGPNYYGLRPHAVKAGLDAHDLSDLTVLAQYGRVSGILSYDAWYEGRNGQTGWFLLPIDQAADVQFNVNGELDPTFAAYFGASPRRCNGTGLAEKMIRAVEPDRNQSGFLGRSTCTRSKMDISTVIAASTPAVRHKAQMTFDELTEFDTLNDPLVQRDNVMVWPTPYAFHRTISLPVIWQTLYKRPDFSISEFRAIASELAETLNREGTVGVRLQTQDWSPQHLTDTYSNHLPFRNEEETVILNDIQFTRFDFVILCAPQARADCDAVDVSALLDDAQRLRDRSVLDAALARAEPLPEDDIFQRDVMRMDTLRRNDLLAPTSNERRFSVTWYDARTIKASK